MHSKWDIEPIKKIDDALCFAFQYGASGPFDVNIWFPDLHCEVTTLTEHEIHNISKWNEVLSIRWRNIRKFQPRREVERINQTLERRTGFVGEIGKKITAEGRIHKILPQNSHPWLIESNKKHICLFLTDDGRLISFSCAGVLSIGTKCQIKGTVKRHLQFGKQKQTHIIHDMIMVDFSRKQK